MKTFKRKLYENYKEDFPTKLDILADDIRETVENFVFDS
jgi:hypothetical protein